MKRTLLVLTLLTAATASIHAAYHGEAAMSYGESDGDSKNYGLHLSWFIDPLTAAGTEPLAEAAFVERPRMLNLSAARSETDLGPPEFAVLPGSDLIVGSTLSLDATARPQADGVSKRILSRTAYELGYTHRRPSSRHVFSLGALYTCISEPTLSVIIEPDTPPTYVLTRTRSDMHGMKLGYGYYVLPRLAISVGAEGTWQDSHYAFADTETRNLDLKLNARWLVPLGGNRWLAFDGAVEHTEFDATIRPSQGLDFERSDSFTAYRASATFYLSRSTSVGLTGYHQPDFDFSSAGLSVRHFLNDRVSIGASASRAFPEQGDASTSYGGVLTCRL